MICRGAYHSKRAAELASAIDSELVEAYRQIVSLDAEIEKFCTTISDDDRYEHQGYQAAEDARFEAIALLSETPASSWKGANAKAAVIKMRQIQHDYESTRALAESLADDVMQFAAAGV